MKTLILILMTIIVSCLGAPNIKKVLDKSFIEKSKNKKISSSQNEEYLELKQSGYQLHENKNDHKALEYYFKAAKLKIDGELYYFIGNSLFNLSNYNDTFASYNNALLLNYSNRKNIYYNLSCLFSRMQNFEQSLNYLIVAVENEYNNFSYIQKDDDLSFLRTYNNWSNFFHKLRKYDKNKIAELKICHTNFSTNYLSYGYKIQNPYPPMKDEKLSVGFSKTIVYRKSYENNMIKQYAFTINSYSRGNDPWEGITSSSIVYSFIKIDGKYKLINCHTNRGTFSYILDDFLVNTYMGYAGGADVSRYYDLYTHDYLFNSVENIGKVTTSGNNVLYISINNSKNYNEDHPYVFKSIAYEKMSIDIRDINGDLVKRFGFKQRHSLGFYGFIYKPDQYSEKELRNHFVSGDCDNSQHSFLFNIDVTQYCRDLNLVFKCYRGKEKKNYIFKVQKNGDLILITKDPSVSEIIMK